MYMMVNCEVPSRGGRMDIPRSPSFSLSNGRPFQVQEISGSGKPAIPHSKSTRSPVRTSRRRLAWVEVNVGGTEQKAYKENHF